MIEKLEKIDSDEKQRQLDSAIENSADFERLSGIFEEVAGSLDEATTKYSEGDMSGQRKVFRKRGDGLIYELRCKTDLEDDWKSVECKFQVRTQF